MVKAEAVHYPKLGWIKKKGKSRSCALLETRLDKEKG
jgi:hypothetical protein